MAPDEARDEVRNSLSGVRYPGGGRQPEHSQRLPRIVIYEAVCSRCHIFTPDSRDLHIDNQSMATHQLDEFSRRTATPGS